MPSRFSPLVIGTTYRRITAFSWCSIIPEGLISQVKGESLLEENYQSPKRQRISLINYLSGIGLLVLVSLFCLIFFYQDPLWEEQPLPAPEIVPAPEEVASDSPSSDDVPVPEIVPDDHRIVPDDQNMNRSEFARRRESIDLSARYLIDRITLDTAVTPNPQDIMMNHAGAMYALGMYHDFHSNDETRSALRHAGDFLQSYGIAPLPEDDRLLEAWSRHELTAAVGPVQAKLGGGGLGLVALLSLEKAAPGSTSLKKLRALAGFILTMQHEDGSFSSDFIRPQDDRWDNWNPENYPSEISLGLLLLYELDSDPRWVEGATKALTHLAREREYLNALPADHWSLLATAQLFSLPEGMISNDDRRLLLMHSIQVARSIMYDQIIISDSPLLIGGFSDDGRTTPTATRLEALLAALEVIPESETRLRDRISESAHRGMLFLINAQVLTGEHAGAMPRAIRSIPAGRSGNAENFNRRAGEMRIDYVQHSLCAMIQYVETFGSDQNRTAFVEN